MSYMFKFNPRQRVTLTQHAILRMPQRAKTDDTLDLVWRAVDLLRQREPCRWLNPPNGVWMVPLPGGSCAVLTRDQTGAKKLVVKTILRAGMWDDDIMNRSRIEP